MKIISSILLFVSISVMFCGCGREQKDAFRPETVSFAMVCRAYQRAVGVVTLILAEENGTPFSYEDDYVTIDPVSTLATAFAISENSFVTNAHVIYALQHNNCSVPETLARSAVDAYVSAMLEYDEEDAEEDGDEESLEDDDEDTGGLEFVFVDPEADFRKEHAQELDALMADYVDRFKGVYVASVEVRLAHSQGRGLPISSIRFYEDYANDAESQAEVMVNGEKDLAILTVDQTTDVFFPLADLDTLYSLSQGEEIGSLGFPMANTIDEGYMNKLLPEATFKRGSISKITAADYAFSLDQSKNRTIFHDIPTVGGSSGSPLFLKDGRVIAVIWGTTSIDDEEDEESFFNPAQLSMAVRVDALADLRFAAPVAISDWLN